MPTTIGWTDETWNPGIAGCSEVSAGCENCYAKTMAHRLAGMPHSKTKYAGTTRRTAGGKIQWTGKINLDPDDPAFYLPLRWKKPRMVFVDSMTDLFHDDVPFEFVDRMMAIVALSRHTFQVLTKRPDRMLQYFKAGESQLVNRWCDQVSKMGIVDKDDDPDWAACWIHNRASAEWPLQNLLLGTSAENHEQYVKRAVPMWFVKRMGWRTMLSCEPLLGPINLFIENQGLMANLWDWVIAGGESGMNARPMHPDWVRGLRDDCKQAGVPFFFKQWGEWAPDQLVAFNGPFHHGFIIPTKPSEFRALCPDGYSEKYYSVCDTSDPAMEVGIIDKTTPNAWWMAKIGKKAAGNHLDGVQHLEFPSIKKLTTQLQ